MTAEPSLCGSVLDVIGNTPLVELSRIGEALDGRIFAKLEYLNPGYSKKDRIARQLIEDAEAKGDLHPGDTVVELTSGNTGTGLAIVCAAKGYRFVAVMSRGNSPERARMMSALGAEVVLVDQCSDSQPGQVSGADLARVEEKTQQIVRERGAYRADQFQLEETAALTIHTLRPKSGGSPAASTLSAILSAAAVPSPAARDTSSSVIQPFNVTLWNRKAQPLMRVIRSRDLITRYRAAATP